MEHQQPWVKPRGEAGTLAWVDRLPSALSDVAGVKVPLTLPEAGHSLGQAQGTGGKV